MCTRINVATLLASPLTVDVPRGEDCVQKLEEALYNYETLLKEYLDKEMRLTINQERNENHRLEFLRELQTVVETSLEGEVVGEMDQWRELRDAAEKEELPQAELREPGKFLEDNTAEADFEKESMLKRIEELEETQKLSRVDVTEHILGAEGSRESEIDSEDSQYLAAHEEIVPENATQSFIGSREPTGSRRNSYSEVALSPKGRSDEVASRCRWTRDDEVCEDGAVSSAASMRFGSIDGQSEKCPICLSELITQMIGTPGGCNHNFCLDCIMEWSQTSNTCPVDRQVIHVVTMRSSLQGEVIKKVRLKPPMEQQEEDTIDFILRCGACRGTDTDYGVIVCCTCGQWFHLDCVHLTFVSDSLEGWVCSDCSLIEDLVFEYGFSSHYPD
jgi:hypothetical protein